MHLGWVGMWSDCVRGKMVLDAEGRRFRSGEAEESNMGVSSTSLGKNHKSGQDGSNQDPMEKDGVLSHLAVRIL